MDSTTAELLGIYQRADQDFKGIIFSMITLAGKYGEPFLKETEGPALAGDRAALKEVFHRWEAKAQ